MFSKKNIWLVFLDFKLKALCFRIVWRSFSNNRFTNVLMAIIIGQGWSSHQPIRSYYSRLDLISELSLFAQKPMLSAGEKCIKGVLCCSSHRTERGTQVLEYFYCLCREEGWESEGRWPGGGSEAGAALGRPSQAASGGYSHCLSLPTLLLLFYPLPQYCFHFPFLSV